MQQYNKPESKPEFNYITHWAARPKWTASEFAHLICGREPTTSDWREERGFGQTNLGVEYKRSLEAIILWLENDLNMQDVRDYTEATPPQFIGLATSYGYDVPVALTNAVQKYAKARSEKPIKQLPEPTYTTPYLDLMKEAIIEHKITADNQPKHAHLSGKFMEKEVAGKKISKNIADAMSTLIRLPDSQAGAGKTKKKG